MGVRLRLGGRVAIAAALAGTLLLGVVGRGGARVADASSVSIGDATAAVVEGQSGSFPVTIQPAATQDFTVHYTVSDGGSGTFQVTTGQDSLTASIPTASNSVPEDDRDVTVTLTSIDPTVPDDPAGVPVIGTATAKVHVVDDDWQIGNIVTTPNPPSVSEKGSNTIDFAVSLNAPASAGHPVTVDYAVADGSAQRGRDYTVSKPANQPSGTLTFNPGDTSVDVQITSVRDNLYGTNRDFTVTFSNPQGATLAGGATEQVTGTITEADSPPVMGVADCNGGNPVNGGDQAVFPISLGGAHPPTTLPATVDWATVDDSTVAGDYTPASGTVTIPVGERQVNVPVQTANNPPSGDRKFHVQLTNPQNATIIASSGSCTIHSTAGGATNQPTIGVTNPTPVTEPTSGSVPVQVTLTLTPPNPQPPSPAPVTVHWQTQDGTATAPADYTSASGDVTWAPGEINDKQINLTVNANPASTATAPISFTVKLTSTDATFPGGDTATVTIVPQGSTTPVLSIGDASVQKHGGSVPVVVTLKPSQPGAISVDYATADGTGATAAKAGVNYTATSGTLSFAPGQTTKTITIPILANQLIEPNRTFSVNLTNATGGAVIAVASATVTIVNDVSQVVHPPIIKQNPQAITKPTPVPTTQPTQKPTATHLVLIQMLTASTKVDKKGTAVLKVGCPSIVIRSCNGKAVFEVRVKQKVGKRTVLKNVRVATGSYKIPFGRNGTFAAKMTPAGMKLLTLYRRMQVKVTMTSSDASGAKGVTAWLVSLQAPPQAKSPAKPTATKKK